MLELNNDNIEKFVKSFINKKYTHYFIKDKYFEHIYIYPISYSNNLKIEFSSITKGFSVEYLGIAGNRFVFFESEEESKEYIKKYAEKVIKEITKYFDINKEDSEYKKLSNLLLDDNLIYHYNIKLSKYQKEIRKIMLQRKLHRLKYNPEIALLEKEIEQCLD